MKKIILIALCVLLGCFALAGCSESEPFEEKNIPARRIMRLKLYVLL